MLFYWSWGIKKLKISCNISIQEKIVGIKILPRFNIPNCPNFSKQQLESSLYQLHIS